METSSEVSSSKLTMPIQVSHCCNSLILLTIMAKYEEKKFGLLLNFILKPNGS
jgi:hypothetical protein